MIENSKGVFLCYFSHIQGSLLHTLTYMISICTLYAFYLYIWICCNIKTTPPCEIHISQLIRYSLACIPFYDYWIEAFYWRWSSYWINCFYWLRWSHILESIFKYINRKHTMYILKSCRSRYEVDFPVYVKCFISSSMT
jgi:hypothetical protein